jgi:hypothetical protein
MPTPQFEEIGPNLGFDKNALPRWQMVALKSTIHNKKIVFLRFGDGMNVINQNPPVATLTEDPSLSSSDTRAFIIEGISPGVTFIDVFDSASRTLFPRRLEVEVKDNRRFKISYHFVDKTAYKTTDITNQVHNNLNSLFEGQANINFDLSNARPLMSIATLIAIVFELKNADRRKPSQREWDTLIDSSDKGADFNVFFMPWDGRPENRPTEMLARDNQVICPDGLTLEQVERALAHEIGRFLFCDVVYNEKQREQLMFRSSSDKGDLVKFVRGGDHVSFESRRLRNSRFITKDCANTMNPTFGP